MLRYFGIALTIFVFVLFAIAMILFSPFFGDWRRDKTADFLSDLLDQSVSIQGEVGVNLGKQLTIDVSDITIENPLHSSAKGQHVDKIELSFPLLPVFAGKIAVNLLAIEGARLDISVDDSKKTAINTSQVSESGKLISSFLNNPISGNFDLRNVTINLQDNQSGWNEKIEIKQLKFKTVPKKSIIQINGDGSFNSLKLYIDGIVGDSSDISQRQLDLQFSIPGSITNFNGSIDTSNGVAIVNLKVDSESDSLGDLLESIKLARVIEGTGQLSGRIVGSMGELVFENIKSSATEASGIQLEATGRVAKIGSATEIDLIFRGNLPSKLDKSKPSTKLFNIEVSGFNGRLSGNVDEMVLKNFKLATNIASAEIRDIGPISIERIAKDEKGRLGLYGIHILDGPPEARTLNLTGEINDVLQLTGISLSGKFDIATAELFAVQNSDNAALLGRLGGRIAITDTDGNFGVDKFEASVSNSDLIELKFENRIGNIRHLEDISLAVDLDIAKFSSFMEVLGQKSTFDGQLKFMGRAAFSDDIPVVDGTLKVGKTVVSGKLKGELRQDRPFIIGEISSELLQLSVLRTIVDVLGVGTKKSVKKIDMDDEFVKDVGVDIKIQVQKIAGADKSVGKIDARVMYDKEIITLTPLQVSYLGGVIDANASIDTKEEIPRMTSSGKITKLPVGRILGELGAPRLVTGSLTTKFDISGSGKSADAILKSLSGNISASIWGGILGTNLLDLSGMNLVTWLATKSDKTKIKLVCAIMPFSFKNGRGSTSRTVFETDAVQIVGGGTIDFRKNAINLNFRPIPKLKQMVDITTPFHIGGKLSNPSLKLEHSVAERATAEFMAMPLNFMGLLMTDGNTKSKPNRPCVIPKKKPAAKAKTR